MTISLEAEPVPLELDKHVVIKVKGHRITLDTVVGAFKRGNSAEEILDGFLP